VAFDPQAVMDTIISHALATGWFDRVQNHEPKQAPGNGLSAALWVDRIDPVGAASGLDSTSIRVLFMMRIYTNMLQEPQDAIDPNVIRATFALMQELTSDLGLGAQVRNVDVMGTFSDGLNARAGYVKVGDSTYRVMTISIPVVSNDSFDQAF
jgi:hypothetical protein